MATAWLNIGMAQHLAGDRVAALAAYQACLALSREINLALAEVKALYNLAEAGAELGQFDAASSYWQQGMEAARLNRFDDQVRYFVELATLYPQLGGSANVVAATAVQSSLPRALPAAPSGAAPPGPDAARIVALARQYGQLTPRLLTQELAISKPTATRRLRELTAQGLLTAHGKGRATCYVASVAPPVAHLARQAQLAALCTELAAEYGLTALYVVRAAPEFVELAAHFARLPDLAAFFRLEGRLAAGLGCTVHHKPETVLDEEERQGLRVVWVAAGGG